MDKRHTELYEYAQKRMQDLYNWLKDKYNVNISYATSFENYMKLSDLTNTEIVFKDIKAVNNSITLHTYNCDKEAEYFLSLWYYTGGDKGHHDIRLDIKKDLVADDDFFFEYVNDYIKDFFKLQPKEVLQVVETPKKPVYRQISIFDLI